MTRPCGGLRGSSSGRISDHRRGLRTAEHPGAIVSDTSLLRLRASQPERPSAAQLSRGRLGCRGFTPWPEHDNGLGYLNGGIIATVLDCHSAAVVLLEAERHDWTAGAGATLPYVTAGLDLRYLRPSPLGETVELRGVVLSADEAEIVADVELLWDGKTRAAAERAMETLVATLTPFRRQCRDRDHSCLTASRASMAA